MIGAAVELDLRVDAVLLKAMLAVARRDGRTDVRAALTDRLASVESRLAREPTRRPLAEVSGALDLTSQQLDFLWTAIAVSAEPRLTPHVEALLGAAARRGITMALYTVLSEIDDGVGRELALWLAGDNPLIEAGLLRCVDDMPALPGRPYVAAARLIAHVAATPLDDSRIMVVRPNAGHLFDEGQSATLARLATALDQPGALVVVEGPLGAGRIAAIARAADRRIAVLDLRGLGETSVDEGVRALRCEALLDDALPVIDGLEELGVAGLRVLGRALDRWPATIAVTSATASLDLETRRALVRIAWPVPGVATRSRLWTAISGVPGGPEVDALALRYSVGPGAIARAAASAQLLAPDERPPTAGALAAGIRHNIAEKLGGVAHHVEITQTWDDLVLAEDTREQVGALVARVRHAHHVLERWGYRSKMARGTGVPALFSGPPGTGKTMVAGLIARELDLELYQVDLSQVVSKWVGETEKQLARVFDVAEQGHALLLFDEADALFGQRTAETRGAVDRYANLEVNFLLQRVESFGGVTILTTNLDTAIDRALKRRLAAHIVFDLPEEDERLALWQRLTATSEAPLSPDLDFSRLARDFAKMSGANIRNAALAAAFLAAADGADHITQEHLLRAARVEYRSMGHVLADRRGP